MLLHIAISVLPVLLLVKSTSGQGSFGNTTSNCIYSYAAQPPSEITCNVYANSFIALDCSTATFEPTNYTIQWYFDGELLTNLPIRRLETATRQPGVPTIHFRASTLFLIRSNIQPGQYYCQIELIGSNNTDIEFLPSNMLHIGTEESLQNASLCNTSSFSMERGQCALAQTITTASIIPSTTIMVSDHSSATFPIWGIIVASIGSVLLLAFVIISLVSILIYVRRHHFKREEQTQHRVPNYVYEERSEENSSPTDHIYEELDTCFSDSQQPFTDSALESEMEHIQQHNMEHEELEIETQQSQDFESAESEKEYRLQYSSETESETSYTQELKESEINSSSKGYDKLLIIKPPSERVINNYYDCLDPQLTDNLSYSKRELLDPQLTDNLSYSKREPLDPQVTVNPSYSRQLNPMTNINKAYNKRDELDPPTDACPAYDAMNALPVTCD